MAESPIASAGPSHGNNTAEIARPGDALSPSRRHIEANSSLGPLTNVQINVIDAEESMSAPGNVEVVGQIAGPGVRHAGVYVNGRLAKSIPVSTGGYSAFDLTFPMPAGSDAKIRAYGNGNDFVEASIDTVGGGSGMTAYRNPPMYAAPYGAYPPSPYYPPNPYAYANPNPYAPGYNPYAPNPYPYGYPPPATAAAVRHASDEAVVQQTVSLVRAMKPRHAAALALVVWYHDGTAHRSAAETADLIQLMLHDATHLVDYGCDILLSTKVFAMAKKGMAARARRIVWSRHASDIC